jgi:hypothetical protein
MKIKCTVTRNTHGCTGVVWQPALHFTVFRVTRLVAVWSWLENGAENLKATLIRVKTHIQRSGQQLVI